MNFREPEQDEGPDFAYCPCGICGVVQADHGHKFLARCFYTCEESLSDHDLHDWEPPSDNSPDEPDED